MQPLAAGGLDLRTADGAGAQQHRGAPGAIDDGGLDAHATRPAVEHQQAVAKLARPMGGGGGGGGAGVAQADSSAPPTMATARLPKCPDGEYAR